jgi:hypothetical protein
MPTPEPTIPSGGDYTLVVFADGTEQLAPARIGDVVAFELERGRPPSTSSVADVMWLVWRSLGSPDDFQTWCDSVASIASDGDSIAAARARLPVPPIERAAGVE